MAMTEADTVDCISTALRSMDREGVRFCLRMGSDEIDRWEPGGDIDVLVMPQDLGRARETLIREGWSVSADAGHRGHVFAGIMAGGHWVKVDLVSVLRYGSSRFPVSDTVERRVRENGQWVTAPEDRQLHVDRRARLGRERPSVLERVHRRLPKSRRRGVVVAFMGPDGVGKSSVLGEVTGRIPVAVESTYAGTGRRGQPPRQTEVVESTKARVRETLFLLRKAIRTWRCMLGASLAARRGAVVLMDRHPYDALCVQPNRTRWGGRLERTLLSVVVRPPDLFVLLDAPTDVILARKDELDAVTAERLRRQYRLALSRFNTRVVQTDQPLDTSAREALTSVYEVYAGRRGSVVSEEVNVA